MAISKIQSEKLRHNKVDQYAHSLIREIAFIDYEIGMQSNDPSISEENTISDDIFVFLSPSSKPPIPENNETTFMCLFMNNPSFTFYFSFLSSETRRISCELILS